MSLHEKMPMPDLLKYPLNHNEKKNKCRRYNSFSDSETVYFTNENKQFKGTKRLIPNSYLIADKAFKGTIVNQTLSSLHGGSLEITLTCYSVPLS